MAGCNNLIILHRIFLHPVHSHYIRNAQRRVCDSHSCRSQWANMLHWDISLLFKQHPVWFPWNKLPSKMKWTYSKKPTWNSNLGVLPSSLTSELLNLGFSAVLICRRGLETWACQAQRGLNTGGVWLSFSWRQMISKVTNQTQLQDQFCDPLGWIP